MAPEYCNYFVSNPNDHESWQFYLKLKRRVGGYWVYCEILKAGEHKQFGCFDLDSPFISLYRSKTDALLSGLKVGLRFFEKIGHADHALAVEARKRIADLSQPQQLHLW